MVDPTQTAGYSRLNTCNNAPGWTLENGMEDHGWDQDAWSQCFLARKYLEVTHGQ